MGLFSGKKKKIIHSISMPLLKAAKGGFVRNSVIHSVLRKQSISDGLLSDLQNSYGIQFNRAYNYAKRSFTNGLPTGYVEHAKIDEAAIQLVLERIERQPVWLRHVSVDYAEYGMYVNDFLFNTRKLNPTDNTIKVIPAGLNVLMGNQISSLQQTYENTANTEKVAVAALYGESSSETASVTKYEVTGSQVFKVVTQSTTTTVKSATATPVVEITPTKTVTYLSHDVDATNGVLNGFTTEYGYVLVNDVKTSYSVLQTVSETLSTTVVRTEVDTNKQPIASAITTTLPDVVSTTEITHTHVADATETATGNFSEFTPRTVNEYGLIYYVEYVVKDTKGNEVYKVWIYDTETDTYPRLAPKQVSTLESPFYPVVPLRIANKDLTDANHVDTDLYRTSKRFMNYLGLDIREIADNINENPDIKDVDNAFIWLGVHMNNESPEGIKYLAHFFEQMGRTCKYKKSDYDAAVNPPDKWVQDSSRPGGGYWVKGTSVLPPVNIVRVADEQFEMTYKFHYITISDHQGVVAKKGKAVREITVLPVGAIKPNYLNEVESGLLLINRAIQKYQKSYVTFKIQLDEDTYREIVVHGPTLSNTVNWGMKIDSDLADAIEEDNDSFIVPLHKPVLGKLSLIERTDLHPHTVHLVFNCYTIQKIKWYQTGFFKALLIVVTIVIAIVTYQPQIVAAVAAGGIAVLKLVLTFALNALLISEGLKWAIDQFGLDSVMFLVVVYTLYTGDYTKLAETTKMAPSILRILDLVNAVSMVTKVNNGLELEGINDELTALYKENKIFEGLLDTANELLEVSGIIDPSVFMDTRYNFNYSETPSMFYARTVHSGNVGALTIDALTYYVDLLLRLPDPKYT